MIEMKGRKILLIGGAGFIGHHMALQFAAEGAKVSIVDGLEVNNLGSFWSHENKSPHRDFYLKIINERLELLKKAEIPLHVQDARDYHGLSKIIVQEQPQVIVHLAAVAHAGKSNKDPFSTFDHSLRTLENALDAARAGVEHFIYFSSSMVYGNFPDGFVTEETVCEPLGIYGALKFAGEKMVIAYNQVFKLPYTIVRPSALYGERCVSRRVGQIFIENALKGHVIDIAGDGSDRLDFTYINDLIHGIKCAITHESSRNQLFNLTYGESRSVTQMADILKDHFPEAKINYLPKDELTPSRGTLSVEKAKKMIGYSPKFALEEGFVRYIEWYKSVAQ